MATMIITALVDVFIMFIALQFNEDSVNAGSAIGR